MYESVRIQNFRCFEDLTVDGLTRVNLIVGENNVGKTALLEGVFLLLSVPDLSESVYTIHAMRGLAQAHREPGIDQGLLESLFYAFNTDNAVQVSATRGPGGQDRFTLRTSHKQGKLKLETGWEFADGRRGGAECDPETGTGSAAGDFPPPPRPPPLFLGTRGAVPLAGEAEQFTRMVQQRKKEEVRRSLQVIEPRIKELELLQVGGNVAVHADVGLTRMIPIALLGEGSQRLCSLVLAIGQASGSLALVDEIDTGLHYSLLRDMWKVVARATREFDVQLFATTHSFECMTAAYEAFADSPEDFSMHRLERVNGEIVCKSFGHESLGTALELGFEVR